MKNKLIRAFLVAVFCTFFYGIVSAAQQGKVEGLNFKLGDDVSTVKTALHTDIDPEPMPISSIINPNMDPNKGKTILNLRTKGIRVFFSKKGIAETIRFDAPYEGSVAGVKIGDSEAKVRKAMGKPIKEPWAFGDNRVFKYVLDDTAYVNFDLNETNGVESIFIYK